MIMNQYKVEEQENAVQILNLIEFSEQLNNQWVCSWNYCEVSFIAQYIIDGLLIAAAIVTYSKVPIIWQSFIIIYKWHKVWLKQEVESLVTFCIISSETGMKYVDTVAPLHSQHKIIYN